MLVSNASAHGRFGCCQRKREKFGVNIDSLERDRKVWTGARQQCLRRRACQGCGIVPVLWSETGDGGQGEEDPGFTEAEVQADPADA